MKNIFRTGRLLVLAIFVAFTFFTPTYASVNVLSKLNSLFPKEVVPTPTLTQEDLVNLTKPSVVRIVQYSKGDLNINTKIKLDLLKFTITPTPIDKPVVVPVEEYLTGSGFIITSNGYIVTNSHVVSSEVLINEYLTKIAQVVVLANMKILNKADSKAFDEIVATPDGQTHLAQFIKDVEKAIEKETTNTLDTTITVLNPSFLGDNFKDLLAQGFPATTIFVNKDFSDDQKDVAVIKIDQENLPALPFAHASATTAVVGQKVYIFGFPGNADLSAKISSDFIQPTFSSGVVSAFKNSTNNDFKIIQTDAKISTGSSGSPMLNDKGEVLGVMSLLKDSSSTGDSFSFGVPLDIINASIGTTSVIPETGPLYKHFFNGLTLLAQKHCNQAISEFNLAKSINSNFTIGGFIDSYVSQCQSLQSSGQAIDTDMQEFVYHVKTSQTIIIFSTIGFLILLIFFIIVISLIRKLKKDEKQISNLSLQNNTTRPSTVPLFEGAKIAINTPIPSVPPPQEQKNQQRNEIIVSYIKESQKNNIQPGAIVVELRNKGYSDQDIQQAFLTINRKDF